MQTDTSEAVPSAHLLFVHHGVRVAFAFYPTSICPVASVLRCSSPSRPPRIYLSGRVGVAAAAQHNIPGAIRYSQGAVGVVGPLCPAKSLGVNI